MNPWGLLLIGIGILLIIVGVKGSQHSLLAALTGHAESTSTSSKTTQSNNPGVNAT